MSGTRPGLEEVRKAIEELSGLKTEERNPESRNLDELDTGEILRLIHYEDLAAPAAVGRAIPELGPVVDAAVEAIRSGGRLVYVGAGTSGRLGVLDAAECPPTYGVPPEWVVGVIAGGDIALRYSQEGSEDDVEQAVRDAGKYKIEARDAVFGITARGKTPYVRAFLKEAKRRGAWTGLLTGNRVEKTPELDWIVDLDVGPEVITGSTRMKAGAATKLVLTMISTTTMVRLGRVKGNLMVDLMPNSTKLRARQVKMIMDELGIGLEEAYERLETAGGDLRTALGMGNKQQEAE